MSDVIEDESSNVKEANVETEIARGEQDDILGDYPRPDKGKIKKEPRPRSTPRIAKDVPRLIVRSVSPRIEELARPTRHRVLVTLRERASTLPPTFVDNLTRLVEAESCLTPEEAARVLRRNGRRKKKTTRFPSHVRELTKKITKKPDTITTLDRDATLCQYLIAERFVRSLLERRCPMQRKNFDEIAQVILKRLTTLGKFKIAEDGDERATQQLRLLADVIANWIIEILVEVAQTHKENLEEYCRKRQMKMMRVDDEDDETDSESEDMVEQIKKREKEGKEERKEREKRQKEQVEEMKIKSEERKEDVHTEDVVLQVMIVEYEADREQPDEKEEQEVKEEQKENVQEEAEVEEVGETGEIKAAEGEEAK